MGGEHQGEKYLITARMIKIIDLLKVNKENSYKNIASELKLTDRIVRYDVERINEIFELNKLPLIQKESKGQLIFPKEIDLSGLIEKDYYIYSQEERVQLMKLIILLNSKIFKLNKLCDIFTVSRSTIKNDLNLLEKELEDINIKLIYKSGFFLEGKDEDILKLMSKELSVIIYLLINNNLEVNSFEEFVLDIISSAYGKVNLKDLVQWINGLLEELNFTLTDKSYNWFLSNILIFIWYVFNKKEYPIDSLKHEVNDFESNDYEIPNEYKEKIKGILPKEIIKKSNNIIFLLLNYTNQYSLREKDNYDSNYIEMIVVKLITLMSHEMNVPFENDSLLYEGLVNHIRPLIDRINKDIYIDDDTISLLKEDDIRVYEILSKVIKEIETLQDLKHEDEIVKLSVYFMASIYRVKNYKIKNVLLVCGLGYGTSTMLKEALMNQYKVEVIDTIPAYKVQSYKGWKNIDIIITTTKLNFNNGVPNLLINPILKDEDCKKLESLGISKKKVLVNYDSINRKLDFLNEKDKLRVIEVIKSETGYQSFVTGSKISKLTDILDYRSIKFVEKTPNWRKSVVLATSILEERYFIDEDYKFDIISGIEKMGFYSVMDDNIALLHGSRIDSVIKTSMSLIITKENVNFDGKNVNIIFCLASKDKKEHVPAIISLMRIIKNTDFINKVRALDDEKEIYDEIIRCEAEAMK